MELSDVIAIFALLISGFALYKQIKKDKVSQNTVFFNQMPFFRPNHLNIYFLTHSYLI